MAVREQKPKRKSKLNSDELWEYALRSLGAREHSIAELKTKLARRSESAETVEATLRRLAEAGLTNDRRFAELYASSRLAGQGFGRFRVLRDLRSKRVADAAATEAVNQVYGDADEATLIDSFLARKYRGQNLAQLLSEQKQVASAYRRLRLAGFSSGGAFSALKRHSKLADELPEPADDEEDPDVDV